ncbi:MAG: dephospho-CoA kinase [Proteobacteria bacterium]|nr:dephospho-CoA kinase [Pseudomonadota bacterium]
MVILGLTGSIAMGKTTAAGLLRRLGVPVFEADREVHALLARGGAAVPMVAAEFPGLVTDGVVDRSALGQRVFADAQALADLEAILHPLVRRSEQRFLRAAALRRVPLVVLDIPLLLETGGERAVDATLVVSAPAFIQESRVFGRPGMTPERLQAVLGRQMADVEKRRRADFVVPTGLGRRETLRRLKGIVTLMRRQRGRNSPPSRWPRERHARSHPRYRDHRP